MITTIKIMVKIINTSQIVIIIITITIINLVTIIIFDQMLVITIIQIVIFHHNKKTKRTNLSGRGICLSKIFKTS